MEETVEDDPSMFPEHVVLNNPGSVRVWRIWRALGKQYDPLTVMLQPDWLMDDIMTCERMYKITEELIKDASNTGS